MTKKHEVLTLERAQAMLASMRPENPEDFEETSWVMMVEDYSDNPEEAILHRLIQFHYEEHDNWDTIAGRVERQIAAMEEMGYSLIPTEAAEPQVSESMLRLAEPSSKDYWHWAGNLTAMLQFGYCPECGLVPTACRCTKKND